jgi:hypothetical protein
MDDPVGCMSVQPVETAPATHEDPVRRARGLRTFDPQGARDAPRNAAIEDRQVGMDVERDLLSSEASDPVNRLLNRAWRGKIRPVGIRHALRPRGPAGGGDLSVPRDDSEVRRSPGTCALACPREPCRVASRTPAASATTRCCEGSWDIQNTTTRPSVRTRSISGAHVGGLTNDVAGACGPGPSRNSRERLPPFDWFCRYRVASCTRGISSGGSPG